MTFVALALLVAAIFALTVSHASPVLDKMSPVFDILAKPAATNRQEALRVLVQKHVNDGGLIDFQRPVAVVVGAGPAGLYAAILNSKTHRVVVYDKYYTPNRARFLGLFSPERDLLEKLGLKTDKTTYFPDGKESKRGILSADLDLGLSYVAEALGVKICRGYEVRGIATEHIPAVDGPLRTSLRVKAHRSLPRDYRDVVCEQQVSFDRLIWAGGSRNHQLPEGSVKPPADFPSRYLRSEVVPLEELARRGLLARFVKKLVTRVAEHPNKETENFIREAKEVLKNPSFDGRGVALFFLIGSLFKHIDLNDKATLLSMIYDSHEAGVDRPDEASKSAKKLADEIYEGAFADVKLFSALGGADHERFVSAFWGLLASPQPELGRSFFVSNIAPAFFTEYTASEVTREICAERQSKILPDWLFLNLGIKPDEEEGKRQPTLVRRIHWEGPLPHRQYQTVKHKLMTMYKKSPSENELSNRITYEIMNSLAKSIGAGGINWDRYVEENKDGQRGATRSASVFEARFAASTTTQGEFEGGQRWVIVGDAAQDAWYRFGLGIHDAFKSVDDAMLFLENRVPGGDVLNSYRNFQAVRALQITHAVFAGQYAFENTGAYSEFANLWMREVEEAVTTIYGTPIETSSESIRAHSERDESRSRDDLQIVDLTIDKAIPPQPEPTHMRTSRYNRHHVRQALRTSSPKAAWINKPSYLLERLTSRRRGSKSKA